MKVALVYDRVNKWGGAERVLLSLHKMFPDAPLYTSVYDPKNAPWAKVFDVRTSFLQHVPFIASRHEMYPFLMPLAFESFSFDEYDLVISVTSEAAKGILTKPSTKHICICLTPTRYLWSGYDEYFQNYVFRILTKPIVWYLRSWDKIAAQRPDAYVAISQEVKRRVKKYYGRESEVIYPAIELKSELRMRNYELGKKAGYFLVASRLSRFTAYKRVDIAIQAANALSVPLKIIGTGKDLKYFKKMAKSNVEFLGNVKDEELIRHYAGCTALIFPGKEDFGLVMGEVQLFGKPVIAYRGGGALELIIEGKTGEFFDTQDYRSLMKALEKFNPLQYNSNDCIANGERFSYQQFAQSLRKLITKTHNATH